MESDAGTVEGRIRKDWSRIDKPVYIMDPERGKSSLIRFEVLERHPDKTLVRLTPHTGRSHQLRVHMKSLGHSIVGELPFARSGRS